MPSPTAAAAEEFTSGAAESRCDLVAASQPIASPTRPLATPPQLPGSSFSVNENTTSRGASREGGESGGGGEKEKKKKKNQHMKAVRWGAESQLKVSPDRKLVPALITGSQGCQSFCQPRLNSCSDQSTRRPVQLHPPSLPHPPSSSLTRVASEAAPLINNRL